MKKNIKLVILFLIIGILFLATIGLAIYTLNQSKKIDSLTYSLKTLQKEQDISSKEIKSIQQKMGSNLPQVDSVVKELDSLKKKLDQHQTSIQELFSQIDDSESLAKRFISLGRAFISLENKVLELKKRIKDQPVDLGDIQIEKQSEKEE